ncbi:unnamed protein product [Rotaria sp. Silwood2]|nr:unnamed protein product [Rotaria sp. Silwood2]CAF2900131.1 unnamed protein product [Rotaria sp. Silwood2]CAF4027214.1 unnamed protein product [Rotaria sp. Silwood2]CAF4133237.1 unnamed protein product [Rotaria sp. Silwood2]
MNCVRLTFILLSVFIAIIHCLVTFRRENQDEIDPLDLIRDSYGYDAVVKSCGNKGKCCDIHDACYKRHGCSAISWFCLLGNCQQCNLDIMACVVRQNPGVSSCCSAKNCGQTRP